MTFETAAEVRRFLKQRGYSRKVKIRRCESPFGRLYFMVTPVGLPEGCVISSYNSESRETCWGSDNPEVAEAYGQLAKVLENTNARPQ